MDAALTELTGGFLARLVPDSRPARPAATGMSDADAGDRHALDGVGRRDGIALSDTARSMLTGEGDHSGARDRPSGNEAEGPAEAAANPGAPKGVDGEPLSDEEVAEVERLQERDREVRSHEQAHQTTGGQHAGSPSYDYETGPDGRQYATSGEVPIDTGAVPNDPQATIAKMEQVKRAALAPAEPSAADRAIAAKADQTRLKAQRELAEQQAEAAGDGPAPAPTPGVAAAPRGSLASIVA